MAYVVARPRGRWEIRESYATPSGPRARTLASFGELSDATIDRAEKNARTSFNRDDVVRAARRAGAPFERDPSDVLAGALLRRVSHGDGPRPGLGRLLRDRLADAGDTPGRVDVSLADWIGAPLAERGAALVDLLGLVDRLPKTPRTPLAFPGLSRARLER
jgi:hypothetical protein